MFSKDLLSLLLASIVANATRIGLHISSHSSVEKTSDFANIRITYNASFASADRHHGNDIGRIIIKFPIADMQAQLTSQGFLNYPQRGWQDGMILGKADEYIWPIPDAPGGFSSFTFDHGVSDLVFGDAKVHVRNEMFRPVFDKIIYSNGSGQGGTPSLETALETQLLKEQKDSRLKLGVWQRDGIFIMQSQEGESQYTPRLKIKDGSSFQQVSKQSTYQMVSLQRPSILDIDNLFSNEPVVPNNFVHASAVRADRAYMSAPSMGHRNHAAAYQMPPVGSAPVLPAHSGGYRAVASMQYGVPMPMQHGMRMPATGYNVGMSGPGLHHYGNHGAMAAQGGFMLGATQHGGRVPTTAYGRSMQGYGSSIGRPMQTTSVLVHNSEVPPHQMSRQSMCSPKTAGGSIDSMAVSIGLKRICGRRSGERCSTVEECNSWGGRWKQNNGCNGGHACGCCKDLPSSLLESNQAVLIPGAPNIPLVTQQDCPPGMSCPPKGSPILPVEISVEWLTPVLQKFQCVSLAPQHVKTGASSLFLAMGWDIQNGIQKIDIDLSLVPVDNMKRVITEKMVWNKGTKAPRALQGCNGDQYAMRSFHDDQTGDQPGDDELVKVNLGCLGQQHPDIEAVVVMANINEPQHLTWSQIDSAYLRIISGGQEMTQGDNTVVRDAEAVRSFVRLSGIDLKNDPDLNKDGVAVGMFFRQAQDGWAFATLLKGLSGSNVQQSEPHLQYLLTDLVYPANLFWETQDQQAMHNEGTFGRAGIHGKATVISLIANGQLPCVASRRDQANLLLGRMTPNALGEVEANDRLPQDVRKVAGRMTQSPELTSHLQGMSETVQKMEQVRTEEERRRIAEQQKRTKPAAPTVQQSNAAMVDLNKLYNFI